MTTGHKDPKTQEEQVSLQDLTHTIGKLQIQETLINNHQKQNQEGCLRIKGPEAGGGCYGQKIWGWIALNTDIASDGNQERGHAH